METRPAAALPPGVAPPTEVDLGDLLMRQWRPEDLVPRFEAISASYDHLSPWTHDFDEFASLDGQRAFGEKAAEWPGPDGAFRYGIFDAGGAVLGGMTVVDRLGPGALELGYWCVATHAGRGVVTRCTAELTRIGLELPGIDRIEIHCDAANTRSAAVPQRLGYHLVRTVPAEKHAQQKPAAT
ncbi:GNAT family N-acetyltransferase [Nocardia transvalensis]|uniref:GNAT family N-acetyltransferase n=1 Tax=Nocardia transvalensis TaxID=37333 RepID=UPI001E61DE33|nr:GNAT family N-acetyltransferase [Nocardia transvalensis]